MKKNILTSMALPILATVFVVLLEIVLENGSSWRSGDRV